VQRLDRFATRPASSLLLCAVMLACGADTTETSQSESEPNWLSPTGSVPEYAQRPGDAVKGEHALVHQPYVNCGIPARVFRSLQQSSPTKILSLSNRDPSMDGLPYFSTLVRGRTGIPVVSNNCLTCHATSLFGELVIGLGNEFLDFTTDPRIAVERAGVLVRGADETTEWELFADRIAAIAPYVQMETRGVNPANNLTMALIMHRDADTNAWLDKPQLPVPSTNPPPVSVPPWWRMSKKHAMFSLSEARDDHARIMLAASMLCADSVDELNAIDSYAPDIRAYLSNLRPPPYPFHIDKAQAAAGRAIFAERCSTCHGTYGAEAEYPNQVVPIDVIGTDKRLMEFATGDTGKLYAQWFNRSWYGELSRAAPARGYIAPPLDGIWATAPYLHNGSVPNLRLLLQSTQRPKRWRHTATDANNAEHFDRLNVGWNYKNVAIGSDDPSVYDTNRAGYANTGHKFGDNLTEAQRAAVLEYLKTL